MISWQTHNFKPWLRTVALLTVCVFTFTSVVWDGGAKAYASAPNPASLAPVESVNANAVLSLIDRPDLPDSYGTIKSSFKGNREQVILAIQDAHINEEAQRNIANILRHFSEKYQLGLVNLEGASGELYTELFSFFPDKEARRNVADYFLKEGRLTGPEYLAIVEKPVMTLYGVEDPELYEKNRKAYVDALQFKVRDEAILASLNKVLEYMGRFVFPEEMRELYRRRAAFQESGRELVAYVRFLVDLAQKHNLKPENYGGMQSLIQLIDLEKQIDFDTAEKETDQLINDLKRMLSSEKLSRFLSNTVHFRMKKMKRAAYYGYLQDEIRGMSVAQTGGEDLTKKYANVLAYLQYMMLYDSIGVSLFDEIEVLEKDVKKKLLTTPEEIKLDHLLRIYDIMSKMFDFTLTKQDAEFYYTHQDEFKAGTFSSFLKPLTLQYHFSLGLPSQMEILDQDLPRVERFYQAALERDQVLVERAVEKTLATGQKISAIITGGFHTPGIEKYLQEKGISYIVVAPRISKAIDKKKESTLYDAALREAPLSVEKVLSEAFLQPKTGVLNDPRFQLAPKLGIPSVAEIQAGENLELANTGIRLSVTESIFAAADAQKALTAIREGAALLVQAGRDFVVRQLEAYQGAYLDGNKLWVLNGNRVGVIVRAEVRAKSGEVKVPGTGRGFTINMPDGHQFVFYPSVKEVAVPDRVTQARREMASGVAATSLKTELNAGIIAEMGTIPASAVARSEARGNAGDAANAAREKTNIQILKKYKYKIDKTSEAYKKIRYVEDLEDRIKELIRLGLGEDLIFLNYGFKSGVFKTLQDKINALDRATRGMTLDPAFRRELLTDVKFGADRIERQIRLLKENGLVGEGLPLTMEKMKMTRDAIKATVAERPALVKPVEEVPAKPPAQPPAGAPKPAAAVPEVKPPATAPAPSPAPVREGAVIPAANAAKLQADIDALDGKSTKALYSIIASLAAIVAAIFVGALWGSVALIGAITIGGIALTAVFLSGVGIVAALGYLFFMGFSRRKMMAKLKTLEEVPAPAATPVPQLKAEEQPAVTPPVAAPKGELTPPVPAASLEDLIKAAEARPGTTYRMPVLESLKMLSLESARKKILDLVVHNYFNGDAALFEALLKQNGIDWNALDQSQMIRFIEMMHEAVVSHDQQVRNQEKMAEAKKEAGKSRKGIWWSRLKGTVLKVGLVVGLGVAAHFLVPVVGAVAMVVYLSILTVILLRLAFHAFYQFFPELIEKSLNRHLGLLSAEHLGILFSLQGVKLLLTNPKAWFAVVRKVPKHEFRRLPLNVAAQKMVGALAAINQKPFYGATYSNWNGQEAKILQKLAYHLVLRHRWGQALVHIYKYGLGSLGVGEKIKSSWLRKTVGIGVKGFDAVLALVRLVLWIPMAVVVIPILQFMNNRMLLSIVSLVVGLTIGAFLPAIPIFAGFFALLTAFAGGNTILVTAISGLAASATVGSLGTMFTTQVVLHWTRYRQPVAAYLASKKIVEKLDAGALKEYLTGVFTKHENGQNMRSLKSYAWLLTPEIFNSFIQGGDAGWADLMQVRELYRQGAIVFSSDSDRYFFETMLEQSIKSRAPPQEGASEQQVSRRLRLGIRESLGIFFKSLMRAPTLEDYAWSVAMGTFSAFTLGGELGGFVGIQTGHEGAMQGGFVQMVADSSIVHDLGLQPLAHAVLVQPAMFVEHTLLGFHSKVFHAGLSELTIHTGFDLQSSLVHVTAPILAHLGVSRAAIYEGVPTYYLPQLMQFVKVTDNIENPGVHQAVRDMAVLMRQAPSSRPSANDLRDPGSIYLKIAQAQKTAADLIGSFKAKGRTPPSKETTTKAGEEKTTTTVTAGRADQMTTTAASQGSVPAAEAQRVELQKLSEAVQEAVKTGVGKDEAIKKFQDAAMKDAALKAVMEGKPAPEQAGKLKGFRLWQPKEGFNFADGVLGPNTRATLSLVAASGFAAVGERTVQETAASPQNARTVASEASVSGPGGAAAEKTRQAYEERAAELKEKELRLNESRRQYVERLASYFASDASNRIAFASKMSSAERDTANDLFARSGFIKSFSSLYAEALKLEAQKMPVGQQEISKLDQDTLMRVLNAQLDDREGLKKNIRGGDLSDAEIAMVRKAFEAAIQQRAFGPQEVIENAPFKEGAIIELPLYDGGKPLSYDQMLEMAIALRLNTVLPSQAIAQGEAKFLQNDRHPKLKVVARAGTDFVFKGVGIGLEGEAYLFDTTKKTRAAFATDYRIEAEMLVERERVQVSRELRTHLNNYARATVLEQDLRRQLSEMPTDEALAKKRTREGFDTDAAVVIGVARRQLERTLKDRLAEKEEILRLIGGLIGVTDRKIQLPKELDDPTFVAERLKQNGAQPVKQGAGLDLAAAQGKYSHEMIAIAYEKARQKMSVVFKARIFFNPPKAFDFRSPLSFVRDPKTPPMISMLSREVAAMQYYQDAQRIKANMEALSERSRVAAEIAQKAQDRADEAEKLMVKERAHYRDSGRSQQYKAAIEAYSLAQTQVAFAYHQQRELQIEIDRYAAGVNDILAKFEKDFESDRKKAEKGESRKLFDAKYFEELENRYQDKTPVDAKDLESNLAAGTNVNLHFEEMNERRIAEGVIQALDASGIKFTATIDGKKIDDLQHYEAKLFDEYERATAPKDRDIFQKVRDLFRGKVRGADVIWKEIQKVNDAKHQILDTKLPEIMRSGWLRWAGYDETLVNGTKVHRDGEIEILIKKAEESGQDTEILKDALARVRQNLKDLGEPAKGAKKEKFRSNTFVEGGIEAIGVFGGGKGTGPFGTWNIKQDVFSQLDFLYQDMQQSKLMQQAHARNYVENIMVQRQGLDQIHYRIDLIDRAIKHLSDSKQKLLVLGSGQEPIDELMISVTSEKEGVYEGVDLNGRILSVHVQAQANENGLRAVEVMDQTGSKVDFGKPLYVQGELSNGLLGLLKEMKDAKGLPGISAATEDKKANLDRQILWGQQRLSEFEEAKISLTMEDHLAEERMLRSMGRDVADRNDESKFKYTPGKLESFMRDTSAEGFREQLKKGVESWGPERDRRVFDPDIDRKIASQRVRIQWSLLSMAQHENPAQLQLMLPFIADVPLTTKQVPIDDHISAILETPEHVGWGGSASLSAFNGNRATDKLLDKAVREADLRTVYQDYRDFLVHEELVSDNLDKQILNTQDQRVETQRLVDRINKDIGEASREKGLTGNAESGERDLYTAIPFVNRAVQVDNLLNHKLGLNLLLIDRAAKARVKSGEVPPGEQERLKAMGVQRGSLDLTDPANLTKFIEQNSDRIASSNEKTAQTLSAIEEHARFLRQITASMEAYKIPLGFGESGDGLHAGGRFTLEVLEWIKSKKGMIEAYDLRAKQMGFDNEFRQDSVRRLVESAWQDVVRSKALLDTRLDEQRAREGVAEDANTGTAREDEAAINDAVIRTRTMVATAQRDFDISVNMLKFIAGIPKDVKIVVPETFILQKVRNGDPVGQELVTKMFESAKKDPRFRSILENNGIASAELTAQKGRKSTLQAGFFAGFPPSVSAEYTRTLIDQGQDALVRIDQAKKDLAAAQGEPLLRQIQLQALNEFSAFVQNRILLIQRADEFAGSQNFASESLLGYRAENLQGLLVKTVNDVFNAFDYRENDALRLVEINFEFQKSKINLSHTVELMGLKDEARTVREAAGKAALYQPRENLALEQLKQDEAQIDKDAEEVKKLADQVAEMEKALPPPPKVDLKTLQQKLSEEKKPPVSEPRTHYEKNDNIAYAPLVRELWKNIFGADTQRIERGKLNEIKGGLTESVLTEDVFVRIFETMRLTPNERLAMFEIMKSLAGTKDPNDPRKNKPGLLAVKLDSPDFQKFLQQIPRSEKLGLSYAQLIENSLPNGTLTAMNQDATNSALDRSTDFRVLGMYFFYATSLLKGMDPKDLNAADPAKVPDLVRSRFSESNKAFSERVEVDFIFLTKKLENIAEQIQRNKAASNGQGAPVIAQPRFTDAELAVLTRDGLFNRLADVKDRRVDFRSWSEQQRLLKSWPEVQQKLARDPDFLKKQFADQAFLDWSAYSARQVSGQPYFKFETLEDTYQEYDAVLKLISKFYKTNFGRDLGLYGDIKGLSDITAWEFFGFMGKLYDPDKNVRAQRLNTVLLIANYILEHERARIDNFNGKPSASDPSADMLRFLTASMNANNSYADQREVQKEGRSLQEGTLLGEVGFRTVAAIEKFAADNHISLPEALKRLGDAVPQGINAGPLDSVRRGIDDYYRSAPEVKKALDGSGLVPRKLNMKDPRDSGNVSAWYEYGARYGLTIDELKQIISVAGRLYPSLQKYPKLRVLYGSGAGNPSEDIGIIMGQVQFILGVTKWHKEVAQIQEADRRGLPLSKYQLDTLGDFLKWESLGGPNAGIDAKLDARIKEYEHRLDLMNKLRENPKANKGAEEVFQILYGSSTQENKNNPEEQRDSIHIGYLMTEAYVAERDRIPYDRLAQRYENVVKLIDSPAFNNYLRELGVTGDEDLRTSLRKMAQDNSPEGKAKLANIMGRLTGAAKDLPADFEKIYDERYKVLKALEGLYGRNFEGFSTWLKDNYGSVKVVYPGDEKAKTIGEIEKELYVFLQQSKYADLVKRNPGLKAQVERTLKDEADRNFPNAFVEGIIAGMPDLLKSRNIDLSKDDPKKIKDFFDRYFYIVKKFDSYPVVQDAGSLNMDFKVKGLQESLLIADPDLSGPLQEPGTRPLLERVSAGRMLVGTASFWLGRIMDSEAQRSAAKPNYWLSRQAPGWTAKLIPDWISKKVEENKYPESEDQYVDMKKVEKVIIPRAKAAWEAYHGILEPLGYSVTKADIMSVVLNTKEIEKVSDIQEYFEQCKLMLALALGRTEDIPQKYRDMIPQDKLDALKKQNLGRPLYFNEMQGYVIEFRRSLKMSHHSIVAFGYNGPSLAVQKMVTKFIFVEPSDPSKTYLNAAASAQGQDVFRGKYTLPGTDLQQMADKRGALWEALPKGEKARTALLLSTTFLSRWPVAVDPKLADQDFFHFLLGIGAKAKDLQRLQEIARLGQDLEGSLRDEFLARNGKELTYDQKMLDDAQQFKHFLILRLMTRPAVVATPVDFDKGFEARLKAKQTVPANRISELVDDYVKNNHLFGKLDAGSLQKLKGIKDEKALNLVVNDLKTLMQEIVVGDRLAMDPNKLLNALLSLSQDKTVESFKSLEENMLRKYLQLAAEKQEPLKPEDIGAPDKFVQGLSEKLSPGLTKDQQDAFIQALSRGLLSPAQVRIVLTDLAWFRGQQQGIPADLRAKDESLLRFIATGRDIPLVHAGVITDRKPAFYSQEQLGVLGQLAGAQGVELSKQYETYFTDNFVLATNTRIQEETKGGKARPKLSDFLTERGSKTRQMGEFWGAWSVILPIFSFITTIFVLIAAFAVKQLRKASKVRLDRTGMLARSETRTSSRSEMRGLLSKLINTEEETMGPALAAQNHEVRREPLGKKNAPPYLTLRGAVILLVHGAFVGLFLLMSWQVLELTNSNIFWNVLDLFESAWMSFMLSHILTAWLAGRIFPKRKPMGTTAAERDAVERPELDRFELTHGKNVSRLPTDPGDRHVLKIRTKNGKEVDLNTSEGHEAQALPPGHKTSIAYFNFGTFEPPDQKKDADGNVINDERMDWLLDKFNQNWSLDHIATEYEKEFGDAIDKKDQGVLKGIGDFFFLKNVIDSLAYNLDPYGRTNLTILAEQESAMIGAAKKYRGDSVNIDAFLDDTANKARAKVLNKKVENNKKISDADKAWLKDYNARKGLRDNARKFRFVSAGLEYARRQVIRIGESRFGAGSVYESHGGMYTIADGRSLTEEQFGRTLIYWMPLDQLHFEKKQGNILSLEDYLMGQNGPPAATERTIPLLRFSGRVNDQVGAAVVNIVAATFAALGVVFLWASVGILAVVLVGAVMWLMGYFVGRAIMNAWYFKKDKANLKPNKIGENYFIAEIYSQSDSVYGYDPDHLLRNRLKDGVPVTDSGRDVQLFATNKEGVQHIFTMDNKNRLGDNPDNPEYPNERAFINVVRKLVEVASSKFNWAGIIIPRTKVVTERPVRTFFTMTNDFASNHGVFYAHALQLIRGRGNFTGKALVNLHSHYHTGDARNMPSRWWTVLVFTLVGFAAGPIIVFPLLSAILPLISSALPFLPGALSFLLSAPLMVQISIGQIIGLITGLWVSGKSAGSFGVVTIKELSHDYKEGDTTGAVFVDNAAILEPSTPTFFEMEGRSFVRWAQGDLMRVYDIFQPGIPLAARWMSFVAVLGYINPIIFGFWIIKRFFFDPSLSGMANMYSIMVPRSTEFLMTSCVMPQLWVGVVIGIVVALLIVGYMRRSKADAEQLSGKKALGIIHRILMPGFLVALLGVVGVVWPAWLPLAAVLATMIIGSFVIALILEWTKISEKMNGPIFVAMAVALVAASIAITAKLLPAFIVLPFPAVGLLFIGVLFVVIVFPVLFGSIQGQTWGKIMLLYQGTTTGLADIFLHIKRNFWENPWKLFMQGSQNVSRSWHLTIGTVIGNLIQWISKPAMILGVPVLMYYVAHTGAGLIAAKLTAWSVLSPWGITGILGTLVAGHPVITAFVIGYLVLRYIVKFTRMIFIVMRDQQLPWATSFGTGKLDGAKSLLRTYMFYSPAFAAALLAIASGVLFHSNLFTFVFGITFIWSWSMAGWHIWLDQFKKLPAGYPDAEEGLGVKGGYKRLGLYWVHVYRSIKVDMKSNSEIKNERKGTLGWFVGWGMRISNVLFHVGFIVGVGLMIWAGVFLWGSAVSAVYFWFAFPMVFVIPALTGFIFTAPLLWLTPLRHWIEFLRNYIGAENASAKQNLPPSTTLFRFFYWVSQKSPGFAEFIGFPLTDKKQLDIRGPINTARVDRRGNPTGGRSEVRATEKELAASDLTKALEKAPAAVPAVPSVAVVAPSQDVTKLKEEIAVLETQIKKAPIIALIGTAGVLSIVWSIWSSVFLVAAVVPLLVVASVGGVAWMLIRLYRNMRKSDALVAELKRLEATPTAPALVQPEAVAPQVAPQTEAVKTRENPPTRAEARAPVYGTVSKDFGIIAALREVLVDVSLAREESETGVLDVAKGGTVRYVVKLDGVPRLALVMVFVPVSQTASVDASAPSIILQEVSDLVPLKGEKISAPRLEEIKGIMDQWTASMKGRPIALNPISGAEAEKALSQTKARSEARAVVDLKSRELVGKIHVASGETPALQEQLKALFMKNLAKIGPVTAFESAEKIPAMKNPQDIVDALSPLGLFGWQKDVPIRGAAWQMRDGSSVTFQDHQQVIFKGVEALRAGDASYFQNKNLAGMALDESSLKAFVDSYHAGLSEQEKALLALAAAFHDYGRMITTGPLHPVVGSEMVKAILEKLGMDARTVRIVAALTSRELEYGALPWGETVPRKVVEGLPKSDIPVFLKLMSFIYILDVAAVGEGKLTPAQLANARYLQSTANLERVQSNWASVRAAGFFEPRDGVILDLSQAIAEEAVPAEIRNELASNPDFKTFMETITFQRIVYVFREMVRQGNPESVTKLVYALFKLQQLTQTDFIGLSVDRKEYATKINDLLKAVPLDQLKAADFRMEGDRFIVTSEGKTVFESVIQQSADKKVVVNVESIPAVRSELREIATAVPVQEMPGQEVTMTPVRTEIVTTPAVQLAAKESEAAKAAAMQAELNAIANAVGASAAMRNEVRLTEVVNPVAARVSNAFEKALDQVLAARGLALPSPSTSRPDTGAYVARYDKALIRQVLGLKAAGEIASGVAVIALVNTQQELEAANAEFRVEIAQKLLTVEVGTANAVAGRLASRFGESRAQMQPGTGVEAAKVQDAYLNAARYLTLGRIIFVGAMEKVNGAVQLTVADMINAAFEAAKAVAKSA
jgi:hypothetical protein